jgi:hypothetical protein
MTFAIAIYVFTGLALYLIVSNGVLLFAAVYRKKIKNSKSLEYIFNNRKRIALAGCLIGMVLILVSFNFILAISMRLGDKYSFIERINTSTEILMIAPNNTRIKYLAIMITSLVLSISTYVQINKTLEVAGLFLENKKKGIGILPDSWSS